MEEKKLKLKIKILLNLLRDEQKRNRCLLKTKDKDIKNLKKSYKLKFNILFIAVFANFLIISILLITNYIMN